MFWVRCNIWSSKKGFCTRANRSRTIERDFADRTWEGRIKVMAKKKHIFLIGFMGVGKSTVSSELSRLSKQREIDTDAQIVKEQKMTIPELFEKKGEAYFRNCETDLLGRLKQTEEALIVSCGGGMA